MENVTDLLRQVVEFQAFANKRGYELMMALGCENKMCRVFDSIDFEDDGVMMRFRENTRHDCPDYESICLKTEELEKNDEQWAAYIEQQIKETTEKNEKKLQDSANRELAEKQKQYEKLKKELGH